MPDCWLLVLHTLVSQELIPPPADALDLALGHPARERKLGVLPEIVPVLPHLVRARHGWELAGFDMVEGREEGAQLAAGGLGGGGWPAWLSRQPPVSDRPERQLRSGRAEVGRNRYCGGEHRRQARQDSRLDRVSSGRHSSSGDSHDNPVTGLDDRAAKSDVNNLQPGKRQIREGRLQSP